MEQKPILLLANSHAAEKTMLLWFKYMARSSRVLQSHCSGHPWILSVQIESATYFPNCRDAVRTYLKLSFCVASTAFVGSSIATRPFEIVRVSFNRCHKVRLKLLSTCEMSYDYFANSRCFSIVLIIYSRSSVSSLLSKRLNNDPSISRRYWSHSDFLNVKTVS